MAYDNPLRVTYTFPARTVSGDAAIGAFKGPAGLTGRVVDISYNVTTTVTTAAATLNVGATADHASNAACTVATGAGMTVGSSTAAQVAATKNLLTADTKIILSSDGGSDAGAADIFVTVEWF